MARKSSARTATEGRKQVSVNPKGSSAKGGTDMNAAYVKSLRDSVSKVVTSEGSVTARKVEAGAVIAARPEGTTLEQVASVLPVRKVRGKKQSGFGVAELSKWATVWAEYVDSEGVGIRSLRDLSLDKLYFWRPSATKLPVKQILDTVADPSTPRQPKVDDVVEGTPAAKAAVKRQKKAAGKAAPAKGAKPKAPQASDDDAPVSKGDWHKVMVTSDLFGTLASLRDSDRKAFPRLDAVLEALLAVAVGASQAEATGEGEALTKALAALPKGTRQALRSLA